MASSVIKQQVKVPPGFSEATKVASAITQGHLYYKKIGKTVLVYLSDVHINGTVNNNAVLFDHLPLANGSVTNNLVGVFPSFNASEAPLRAIVNSTGELLAYYDSRTGECGNFYGMFVYDTN